MRCKPLTPVKVPVGKTASFLQSFSSHSAGRRLAVDQNNRMKCAETHDTTQWQQLPHPLLLACLLAVASPSLLADDFQGATHLMPFDEGTINYSKAQDTSPVARLQERLDRGTARLVHDERFGYLPALLGALKIQTNSQMLVFSKTSFQRERIAPRTPRAIYFNDDVYVGFVQGSSMLEISAVDPKLGGVFYTLDQKKTERPKFVRTDQCLECHASAKTMGVPGHLVRSFATDESGVVDLSTGTSQVTHRTPFAERWGGWYVTGIHGEQPHRGNLFGKEAFARHEKEPNYLGNQTALKQFFDTSQYPTAGSDIVALMVMEHQTHMHNFLTRLNYESTIALQQYGHIKYLKNITEAFLRYLLYTEEAVLSAPIRGSEEFVRRFSEQGPKDRQGRSLRQFDLQTRLFKHPCSYLIYSEAFDQLPEPLKAQIYQRLWDILNGQDASSSFDNLPAPTRRAIREILVETKPGLPDYWKRKS
jgi:hypothetical protein